MKPAKSVPVNILDDSGWEKYYNLISEINKKFYPDDSNENNTDEFKTARLKDCKKHNAREYLVLRNNEPCAWYAVKRDTRSSMFIFDSVNEEPANEEIHAVFQTVYDFMQEFNHEDSFHWSFNKRINDALIKAGGVVNEELITTKLDRTDMNPDFYKSVVNSTAIDGYTLKYFTTFPAEVVDNFTSMMNEVFAGMNKLNPYGVIITERTAEFWIKKYKYETGDDSEMKMFMLFDKDNNIAAYCSLFVDKEYPLKVRHEGGFTVVAPGHRGKGFARFLKAKMYLMLLEENESFTYLTTDTMPWNTYMYRINEEFGFKPYQHGIDLKVTKATVEKFLKLK